MMTTPPTRPMTRVELGVRHPVLHASKPVAKREALVWCLLGHGKRFGKEER